MFAATTTSAPDKDDDDNVPPARYRHPISTAPRSARAPRQNTGNGAADERMKVWRGRSGDDSDSSSSSSSSGELPQSKPLAAVPPSSLSNQEELPLKQHMAAPSTAFPFSAPAFEVRQLDAGQESYFVSPSGGGGGGGGRCFFLMRNNTTGNGLADHLASVQNSVESNALNKLIHTTQPFYRPVAQLSPALVAVFDFILFRLDAAHQLVQIVLNSRVASASMRQQTRFEELLPAPLPDPTKSLSVVGATTLKKRTTSADTSAPEKKTNRAEGDSDDSDHGSAKTNNAKRKLRREKRDRERSKQLPPPSSGSGAYARLPTAKKQLVVQYLAQKNGGRSMRRPLSVIAPAPRVSTEWQPRGLRDVDDSQFDDDDDDDDGSDSDPSGSSSASSTTSSSGSNKGAHRMRHVNPNAPAAPLTPQALTELALARWKLLFNLNDADELRGWFHLQLSGWFEVDAAVASMFTRVDTFETGPTLGLFYKAAQMRYAQTQVALHTSSAPTITSARARGDDGDDILTLNTDFEEEDDDKT